MHKFKGGKLHSGSKSGSQVTDRRQAVAIMLSEKEEGAESAKHERSRRDPAEDRRERNRKGALAGLKNAAPSSK